MVSHPRKAKADLAFRQACIPLQRFHRCQETVHNDVYTAVKAPPLSEELYFFDHSHEDFVIIANVMRTSYRQDSSDYE